VKKAKLAVDSIDLQAFAMLRSLAPKSMLELGGGATAVAVANIASDVTNLVVSVEGEPQFTRIISFGGDNFTRAVQEYRGVSFSEAELLKAQAGLMSREERAQERPAEPEGETLIIPPEEHGAAPEPEAGFQGIPFTHPEQPGEPGSFAGPPAPGSESEGSQPPMMETAPALPRPASMGPEPELPQPPSPELPVGEPEGARLLGGEQMPEAPAESLADVQRVLELAADSLADEIRRSLDYYVSQETSAPITRLLLSGGGALLRNLDSHFSQVFPYEVALGDPLVRISQNRSRLSEDELKALGPQLAIAIGLALEDEE